MALTDESRREALEAAAAAFEEMGGGAALRAELEAFRNLRLLVYAKYPQLQREYSNQWIAMNEDGVVASGESHDAVMAAVQERGVDMSDVAFEYIDAEGSALVL